MSQYSHIPLAELTTPKGGTHQIYIDYWWTVDPELGALIFKLNKRHEGSPQCNSNKLIVERRLKERPHDRYEAIQIPVAYMPHRCDDGY